MRSATPLVLAFCLLLVSGCKTLDLGSMPRPSWLGKKKPEYQSPVRMAVIWSDAMLNHPSAPTRGFGGRIYFYNNKNQAIPVDGELVIYAYDDTDGATEGSKPDRKFVYKGEQLTSYFSETQLGASYSVWVPWDRPGSGRRDVSLVPMFTSAEGARVGGQPSKVTLAGKPGDPGSVRGYPIQHERTTLHRGVQPASYTGSAGSTGVPPTQQAGSSQIAGRPRRSAEPNVGDQPQGSSKTTTIQLPPSTVRRLQDSRALKDGIQKAMLTPRAVNPPAALGAFQTGVHPGAEPSPLSYGASRTASAAARPVQSAAAQDRTSGAPRSRRSSARFAPRRFQAPTGPIDRLDPGRFQR